MLAVLQLIETGVTTGTFVSVSTVIPFDTGNSTQYMLMPNILSHMSMSAGKIFTMVFSYDIFHRCLCQCEIILRLCIRARKGMGIVSIASAMGQPTWPTQRFILSGSIYIRHIICLTFYLAP